MKKDKNKIIFISVIGVVIIFMIVYSISLFGASDNAQEESLQSTFVPTLDEEVKEYESRLEAIDEYKEEKTRNAPSIYDERKLNNNGVFEEDAEKNRKQRMIDSIYASGQMDYNKQPTSAPPKEDWKTIRNRVNDEIKTSHQDFFSTASNGSNDNEEEEFGDTDSVIYAEVNGDQKVMANGRVQMRLSRPHKINGLLYPENTYVYGFVSFAENRCFISINHVDQKPISLTVYDYEDGGKGLFVVNSFRQDASGMVVDQNIGNLPIPGARRLSGLANVFRRTNRRVKVTVVNKYQVLIKPESRK